MKLLDVIQKNDMCDKGHCRKCILSWEQWSAHYEDCDSGCMMQNTPYNDMYGGWFCVMPNLIKKMLKKQYEKRIEKEIDDYCEFIKLQIESEDI